MQSGLFEKNAVISVHYGSVLGHLAGKETVQQHRRVIKGTIFGRWDQGHREREIGREGEGLVGVNRMVSASRQEQQFGDFSKDPED